MTVSAANLSVLPRRPTHRYRLPKYCVPDQWFVLEEPAEVIVGVVGGKKVTYQADCWGHPDAKTLRIFCKGQLLATYRKGKWPGGCYSFGFRKERPQPQLAEVAEAQQKECI